MPKHDFNEEALIEQELKNRLLMLECSTDDPVTEAFMINELVQRYEKYSIKMPEKLNNFIQKESIRVAKRLRKIIDDKKKKQKFYIQKKKELKNKKLMEEKQKQEEEEMKKLTRTQQIWGSI